MSDEVEPYDRKVVMRRIWHSRKIGHAWDQIADEVNADHMTDFGPREIAALYRSYMADMNELYGPEERSQDLGMEIERLNDLQAAWWADAMDGDEKAATIVLNTMKQRHRLKGLDAMDISDRNMVANVLVIGEDKQAWIDALAQGKNKGVIMPGPVREDSDDEEVR